MENLLKLNITQCLEIVKTPIVKPYIASGPDSPLAGKEYRVYSYLGKGFAVNTESDFNDDFKNGDIDSVTLEPNDQGYSFINHISITRAERAHKTTVMRKALTVEYIQTAKLIDLEELA